LLSLYFAPNTCALASHIALEQAGAEYRTVRLDFSRREQQSPDYLRLNPKGRVPTLVTPRGALTETPAILQFICQSFPRAGLAPLDDAFALAQLNAFNSYLCSTLHVAHAHRMRGTRWVDDEQAIVAMQKKVPQSVGACFHLIEQEFFQGPWVMGAHYSVGDIYLFTLAQWMEADGVDPACFPKLAEHRQRMSQLAAVRRCIAAETASA
jgi:glutathione S-transferase